MKRNYADEYDESDAMLNESISEIEPDDVPLASDDELRLARIAEYGQEALKKDDPLQASLALVNCGLLEFVFHSEKAMKLSLKTAGVQILESPAMQRAIRNHLNMTRQVDRLANLAVRIDEKEQQVESAKAQRRMTGMPAASRATYRRGRV